MVDGGTSFAAGLAAITAFPGHELGEAVGAGARWRGARVVVAVLVKRDRVRRVSVTEDVAALSTVVASVEVVEHSLACRVIADGG